MRGHGESDSWPQRTTDDVKLLVRPSALPHVVAEKRYNARDPKDRNRHKSCCCGNHTHKKRRKRWARAEINDVICRRGSGPSAWLWFWFGVIERDRERAANPT